MVSKRCKIKVREELKKLGLHFIVEMGAVDVMESITEEQRETLRVALRKSGLELMNDKKAVLIEKIKKVIIEMVYYSDEVAKPNSSDHISEKLKHDYTYMSKIFSETQGITIERFIILQKIERVKELIIYDGLSLTEIAWKMHYSGVAHLSNQFKKNSGFPPSHFKKLKEERQQTIEDAEKVSFSV